jgi:hypothetical protein
MRIWKLTPTDPTDLIWKDWKPDPVFVRAESESEARHLAQLATAKFLPVRPGQPTRINPWSGHRKIGDPSPTICEDVTDQTNGFSADGPAMVLRHGEKS